MYGLVDSVKNLTIDDAKYYESNTLTVSDTQGDLTRNMETITHNSSGNERVTHTSKIIFEQELLRNWIIPVVVPNMNPRIEQRIALIVLAPQTLLTPATKEVVTDASLGSAWVNSNPR